jgi:hypothetical protein
MEIFMENINNIVINGALNEVEQFVNWVKTKNPQLTEKVLGNEPFYKISDVEKLFEVLDDTQKKDYQFLVDNEHNFIAAARLGLPDASYSMPSGEPGHRLIESLKIVKDASIENIENTKLINFGSIQTGTDVKDALNKFMSNTTGKNMDWGTLKGGTDLSNALNESLKSTVTERIGKVRQVIYFTDGEPTNPKKPSNK